MSPLVTILLNYVIFLAIGAALAFFIKPFGSFYAGLIGLAIGALVTLGVHQLNPGKDLQWAMIAVGAAAYFAGMFGFIAGHRSRGRSMV
jgi:hypothetical protein